MPIKYVDDTTGQDIDPNQLKPFELEIRIVFGKEDTLYFRNEYIVNAANYDRIKALVPVARAEFQQALDNLTTNINNL